MSVILTIELGKYKSVACISRGDPSAATFATLATDHPHRVYFFPFFVRRLTTALA